MKINNNSKVILRTGFFEIIIVFFIVLFIAIVCFPIKTSIGYQTVGLIFLMSVAIMSLFVGRTAVLFAAIMNFVVWNYFFIPPLFTFHIDNFHDVIALFANLVVAIVGGVLITKIRKKQEILIKSQEKISLLYSLLESLNNATTVNEIVNKAQYELVKNFSVEAIIYLKEKQINKLSDTLYGNSELHSEHGFKIASNLFENSNFIQSNVELQYERLTLAQSSIGIIGLKSSQNFDTDKSNLLKSFIVQISLALNRAINIDIEKENQIYMESQKLFQTVLNSVSHELKTPIAIITTAISNLNDEKTSSNPELRRQICEDLNSAAKRLNTLVDHILDMAKLESGYLKLNLQLCDVGDIVGIAINELKSEMQNHKISVNIHENLPLLKVDINLFKQALINILHNAIIYTPVGGEISISVYIQDNDLLIFEFSDTGTGVPEESLLKLFEKFYRVPGLKSGGTGLGLAVSKAIIEIHKGTIFARNRDGGGLSVLVILNVEKNGQ